MFKPFLLQVDVTSAAGAATDMPTEETLSILELLAGGGWYIMIPLYVLSGVAIYIFVERFMMISKASKVDPNFMNQIKDFIYDGKIDSAKQLCTQASSPFSRMIAKGVNRIGKPLGDINAAIENVAKLELFQMEKSLSILATISGAAPMIGFLGTVIGMINTFHSMYAAGSAVEIDQLSGGIMQAMVTTAAGLVIGIIAYLGYNILVARVERVINQMESTTIEFMDILQEPASN